MSTTPEELGSTNNANPGGYNTSPARDSKFFDINMLKNWAPQAMSAIRRSNLRTQMVNKIEEPVPSGSGVAKGLISGLLG